GAVKVDLEDVAAGGVIRDDQGRWILGFNKRLGQYFVFNVGLWGIIDSLLLLKNRHCDKLLIRMNSREELEYIPKEENLEANSITKIEFVRNEGLQLFIENPLDITR
ncbi:hypothetical protein Golob_020293, partial [Gossypium lobatum]|nr:hypothetical protein [Gossypium lobatum]